MPDPFPETVAERLVETSGQPLEAVRHAVARVRSWHEAEGSPAACKLRTPRGWSTTVGNSIRDGWGLEGFVPAPTEADREWAEHVERGATRRARPIDSDTLQPDRVPVDEFDASDAQEKPL